LLLELCEVGLKEADTRVICAKRPHIDYSNTPKHCEMSDEAVEPRADVNMVAGVSSVNFASYIKVLVEVVAACEAAFFVSVG
jgi:hypothetical protein